MKLRSFFSILSGVVLVLLLVGAAGAYWLASSTAPPVAPQQFSANPTAAMFVGRQAPAMVSLLVNPDRLESFWLSDATPENRKQLQVALNRLQQSLFASTPLDYDRDLKPWLGNEITFVVTTPDVDRDVTDGLQAGYLLVLTADDPELAQKTIQSFWQRRVGAKGLTSEQFAGVQLVHAGKAADSDGLEPTLTSAIAGHYVLFANYPRVLRDALNNVQVPELSLERSFTYQQALKKVTDQRIGLAFFNFSQTENLANLPVLASDALESATQRYEGLIAALQPDPDGLVADALLLSASGSRPARLVETNASTALKFIPSNSTLAIASKDLQRWADWQTAWASEQPWLTRLQQSLADLQQRWDVDPETALRWVKGDYALAQIPHTGRAQPDWILVTQQTPETQAAIEQLNQVAEKKGMSLGAFKLEDQEIYAWTTLATNKQYGATTLQADVQGVRATVGDYEIVATSLEALEKSLQAHQATDATSDLQSAIARIETPNQGYLYLNQAGLEQALQSIRLLEPVQRQLFASLRSALLTAYSNDEAGLRSAMVLHLKGT